MVYSVVLGRLFVRPAGEDLQTRRSADGERTCLWGIGVVRRKCLIKVQYARRIAGRRSIATRKSECKIRKALVISVKRAPLNAHASIVGFRDHGGS